MDERRGIKCKCGSKEFIAYLEAFSGRFEDRLILKCKDCGLEYSVDIDNSEYEEAIKERVRRNVIKAIKSYGKGSEVYRLFKRG